MALLGLKSLLVSSFVSAAFAAVTPDILKKTNILPGGYIVEFEGDSLVNPKPSFYSQLAQNNVEATHRVDFTSPIFKGLSFHVDSGLDQAALAKDVKSMSMVKDIWPITLYHTQDVKTVSSPYAYTNGTGSNSTADTFSTHIQGGVSELHAEGITGAGVFVAVIDTGIDYNHPALGGCFGTGCKVAYGYDFVGDAYTGANVPIPDPDPYSSCGEHGTHVAGIVAALPNEYNFTGVAPGATLGSYRVFGCDGSAGDDVLIAAFTRAYEDGADVITASIGGVNGWTEEAWSVAVSRIVAAGTPCTLAAGNDGSEGLFYGSSAADGVGVIAVGSVDNIQSPVFTTYGTYSVDNSTTGQFGYEEASIGIPNITLPLIAINYNTNVTNDACNPLPTDTPDLSGKFVLVKRGSCTYATKAANVAAYGAEYILFYNNVPGIVSASVPGTPIKGAAMVSTDQGVTWIKELQAGSKVVASITGDLTIFSSPVNALTGGYMSTFSEWYPTNEVYIKPEISAPGGNILSTLPLAQGGYGVLSGTSMATPFVAGVIALMKEVRPELDALTIRAILGTTGTPLNWNDGKATYDYLAPVVQQGGGEVDGYAAVHTAGVIDVPNLSFNDSLHFVPENNFTITNRGSEPITYSLSYINAATAYTLPDDGSSQPSLFPAELVSGSAALTFSTDSITIAPGTSETVLVTLTPPQGLTTSRIPVYSGYITLNSTTGDESLNVPYAGVASSLKDATVLDPSTGYPYLTTSTDGTLTPVAANSSFIISVSNGTNITGVPKLVIGLTLASSYIRADLVYAGAGNTTTGYYGNTTTILGVKTLGPIQGSPFTYQPRANAWNQNFYGKLADGTQVPAGSYAILVRALRIFGDRENADDYDEGTTVPFTISYAP